MVVEKRRRPVEAIQQRTRRSVECEQRVRKALAKLTKTGAPFTVASTRSLKSRGSITRPMVRKVSSRAPRVTFPPGTSAFWRTTALRTAVIGSR